MFNLFFKTWKNLKLILFVPDLMLIILNVFLGNLFLLYTNVGGLINKLSSLPAKVEALPIVEHFIGANFVSLVLFVFFFTVINFVIGSGLLSIKYGLMRDTVNKKKPMFFEYSREYFWKIVKLKILVFLLMILVILVFGALATLFYLLFMEKIAFILLTLLLILVLLILKLALLFRFPALFLKDKSAFMAVRNSFLFLKNRFFIVVLSLLMIFIVGFVFSLGYIGISTSFNYLTNLDYRYFVWFFILWQVMGIAINLINNVWSDLFLFYVFKEKQ